MPTVLPVSSFFGRRRGEGGREEGYFSLNLDCDILIG